MAFYKLYRLIHRRTDWLRLLDWERQIMMPEWYIEREKRRKLAINRFMVPLIACRHVFKDERLYI